MANEILAQIINEIESRVRDVVVKMNGEAAALVDTVTAACDYKGSGPQLFSANVNGAHNKQVVQDLYKTTQELTRDFSHSETKSNAEQEEGYSVPALA